MCEWGCLKATGLPTSGQPGGEQSLPVKGDERVPSSYAIYGEDNELLFQPAIVLRSGRGGLQPPLWSPVPSFYIVGRVQRRSTRWAGIASHNAGEHLSIACVSKKNSGLPDGGNSWGNGGLVVTRQEGIRCTPNHLVKGPRFFSTRTTKPTGLEALVQLRKDNWENPSLVNRRVSNILADKDLLLYAYDRIKSRPGNLTPGIDGETLDGINMDWFNTTAKQIATGEFRFRSARRVEIPKPQGGTRPLGVASPRDKVVQEAMRLILEAVFEPQFLDSSHGFRANRSCHSALRQVKRTFGGTVWFVEGDISKCFDSFDHTRLVVAVEERIKDQVFIDMLWKTLKAGYVDARAFFFETHAGTPQGSVISPILCNIYLDKLDTWVDSYRRGFEQGKRRRQNPLYTRITRGNESKPPKERRTAMRYLHENNIRLYDHSDNSFKRLKYVRYADDFLVGLIGSKADAQAFKEALGAFLHDSLNLSLSNEKTKITHASRDRALFLGTLIRITPYEKAPIRKIIRGGRSRTSRIATRPQLLAPLDRIVTKLGEKNFCKKGLRGEPTRNGKYIHLPLDAIAYIYRSIARGYLNYYSFVDNYAVMRARVLYILYYSLVLTFASKLKLGTKHRVLNKFGPSLAIRDQSGKVIAAFDPSTFPKVAPGFRGVTYNPEAYTERISRISPRSLQVVEKYCRICGSTDNLEMHHVKHLRKGGVEAKGDHLLKSMIRMNRKQITVCRDCHEKIHGGSYNGPRLREGHPPALSQKKNI